MAELLKDGRKRNELLNDLVIRAAQTRVDTSVPIVETAPVELDVVAPSDGKGKISQPVRRVSGDLKEKLVPVKRRQVIPKPGWKK